MLGLTFGGVGRIRNILGYHIVEENDMITVIINPKGEKVAEISVNEEALLSITIRKEKEERLKWVYINIIECPRQIVIEGLKEDGSRIWSELPEKENQPVFWTD